MQRRMFRAFAASTHVLRRTHVWLLFHAAAAAAALAAVVVPDELICSEDFAAWSALQMVRDLLSLPTILWSTTRKHRAFHVCDISRQRRTVAAIGSKETVCAR